MPFILKSRLIFNISTMPHLTPFLGPWIASGKTKYSEKLGQQKEIMAELIRQLPQTNFFLQNWHHKYTNWLPFYWAGFQQTTNYTYVIEDLTRLDDVWSELRGNIRWEINKAKDRFELKLVENPSIEDFVKLNEKVYSRKDIKPSFSYETLFKLDGACAERECRKIFIAVDKNGIAHAGAYIVWDENSAYYLLAGSDPKFRNSGAMSFCLWEAIKFSSNVTKEFNFEGSMIRSVERFVRGFGGKQRLVFSVSKTQSCFAFLVLWNLFKERQTSLNMIFNPTNELAPVHSS